MEEGKQLFELKEQTVELVDQGKTCFYWSEPIHKGAAKYRGRLRLWEEKMATKSNHYSCLFGFYIVIVAEYHTCSVGGLLLAQWCARAGPAVTAVLSIVH